MINIVKVLKSIGFCLLLHVGSLWHVIMKRSDTMIEQYNLFGGISQVTEPKKKPTNKYKTMQELHGIKEGQTCKTCANLVSYKYHGKIYNKCQLWVISHSSATDVRIKTVACGKHEVRRG